MNFYYIVDKSCDGTYSLFIKEPGKETEGIYYLTLNDVYARISVSLDKLMCDHALFGGE